MMEWNKSCIKNTMQTKPKLTSSNEKNTTKEYMLVYMILSAYGLISIVLAYFLPYNWVPLSGFIYFGIGPTIYIAMKIHKKKIKSIT